VIKIVRRKKADGSWIQSGGKDDGKASAADAVLDKKAAKALKAQQGTEAAAAKAADKK